LSAQTAPVQSVSLPLAAAAPVTGSITIDGKLDESAWAKATPITDFHQQQPNEGAQPTQRTEVRVLYDERALYIGARMYDSLGARGIRAPLARRDQLLDAVYGLDGEAVLERTIDVHIGRLRDKLEDTAAEPRISPNRSDGGRPVQSPTCARKSEVGITAPAVKRMCCAIIAEWWSRHRVR